MSATGTSFPVFATAYELAAGERPIILEGMEVLFDRTIGFYPVRIEPKAARAEHPTNGKRTNG